VTAHEAWYLGATCVQAPPPPHKLCAVYSTKIGERGSAAAYYIYNTYIHNIYCIQRSSLLPQPPKRSRDHRISMTDLVAVRQSLPIYRYKNDLVEAMSTFSHLVIVGDTGSGKTTQIPQFILDEIPTIRTIAITQPRRIAAISAARRVAEEHAVPLGTTVGYAIRFERHLSPATRLTYMTDGLLLRESVGDPLLMRYDCIILDEAHERSLETDVLFGLLKNAAANRTELKVFIMSATLDVEKVSLQLSR
jgi:HrpA-like RNA helicase